MFYEHILSVIKLEIESDIKYAFGFEKGSGSRGNMKSRNMFHLEPPTFQDRCVSNKFVQKPRKPHFSQFPLPPQSLQSLQPFSPDLSTPGSEQATLQQAAYIIA